MSTPLNINDVVFSQAVCYDTLAAQIGINDRLWRVDTIVTPGVVKTGDVARAVDLAVRSRYKALLFNGADYLGVRCRRVWPTSTEAWESETAAAGPGTAGAVALPTQTSGLIQYRSAQLGKHGQGRTYIPFPAAADNELGGVPRAGYVTAALFLAFAYGTALSVIGTGGSNYLLTPVLRGGPTFITPIPITSYAVPTEWASQRRRGAFGRFNRPVV